jgi:signal transduction histidine kinase
MIQEILNNSVKHSPAKHINLIIHNQENKYILAISDDGLGFNVDGAGGKQAQD